MDRFAKGMTSLKVVLDKALESQGMDQRLRQENAVVLWDEIVGKKIAQASKAVKIERGTLLIEVKSSAWKHQIQMLKPDILKKLNAQLGPNTVKNLRFR
jgi:predicted nucleic acid-binding Zn ribbon protein